MGIKTISLAAYIKDVGGDKILQSKKVITLVFKIIVDVCESYVIDQTANQWRTSNSFFTMTRGLTPLISFDRQYVPTTYNKHILDFNKSNCHLTHSFEASVDGGVIWSPDSQLIPLLQMAPDTLLFRLVASLANSSRIEVSRLELTISIDMQEMCGTLNKVMLDVDDPIFIQNRVRNPPVIVSMPRAHDLLSDNTGTVKCGPIAYQLFDSSGYALWKN